MLAARSKRKTPGRRQVLDVGRGRARAPRCRGSWRYHWGSWAVGAVGARDDRGQAGIGPPDDAVAGRARRRSESRGSRDAGRGSRARRGTVARQRVPRGARRRRASRGSTAAQPGGTKSPCSTLAPSGKGERPARPRVGRERVDARGAVGMDHVGSVALRRQRDRAVRRSRPTPRGRSPARRVPSAASLPPAGARGSAASAPGRRCRSRSRRGRRPRAIRRWVGRAHA